MLSELTRTVWRYELRYLSEHETAAAVEAEVNRLIEEVVSHARRTMGMIHRPSGLMRTCDDGINAALGHKNRNQFTKAVAEIKKVRDAIEEIRRFTAAHEEYEATRGAYRRIEVLLESEYIMQCTSIKVLSGLLSEVEGLLKTAEYRQARTILRMCKQRSTTLETVELQRDARSGSLLQRVERISEICCQSERFSITSDSTIKQACEVLRSIIERGYLVLARRLIEDIEIALAPRLSLVAEHDRHLRMFKGRAAEKVVSAEQLKSMVAQTSWIAATDSLLRTALTELSWDLERLDQDIASIYTRVCPAEATGDRTVRNAVVSDHQAGGVK